MKFMIIITLAGQILFIANKMEEKKEEKINILVTNQFFH